MNLINPGFLFALAAAAVPLLIHLLSRRRAPDLPFSSLRFLRRSDRRSMRRVSLRRLALLAMRTAAIALVVLAFARPVVEGRLAAAIPAGSPRTVVVLLDASYSMGALETGGPVFDRARAAAVDIVGGLEPSDEAAIILFDEAGRVVYSAERAGREGAERALEGVRPGWGGTDLRAALAMARRHARGGRRGAAEIFIVSDFQRSGIRPAGAERGEDTAGRDGPERVFLVPA
ncbi:MAG: BatA and WFA domain-containing protein, partial [Candidatus Krumholzibacteria bacterium]|nr:BatA and WFA domain-containing protein [Candidatus Krumholzibacteria bacterium]